MSLHEIDLAQKISDQVICVKGDRIAEFGDPEEIFTEATIRDLYEIDNGYYDPIFGSVELPKPEGEPEVLVLSSGKTGIPVYRKLQKAGIPFAAGILYPGESDYQLARRCAGHHRTAGAHPPHHHRSAESKGAGVTGSRCLYRKSRNWCSIQTTSFRYAIQRCCCCIKKLNCCHQASQSSLRSPVPLIGGASGKKRKFFSLSKPLLRRRGGIAKP